MGVEVCIPGSKVGCFEGFELGTALDTADGEVGFGTPDGCVEGFGLGGFLGEGVIAGNVLFL